MQCVSTTFSKKILPCTDEILTVTGVNTPGFISHHYITYINASPSKRKQEGLGRSGLTSAFAPRMSVITEHDVGKPRP